jgi:delta24(24(1))-sterol reductase
MSTNPMLSWGTLLIINASKIAYTSSARHPSEALSHRNKCAINGRKPRIDNKVAQPGNFEFGGPWGVGIMMGGFPLLMYYMWIGATFCDGHFPVRSPQQSTTEFLKHLVDLVVQHAFPSVKAWTIYWTFFTLQAMGYSFLPGVTSYGNTLDHDGGKRIKYHCSAVSAFYITILVGVVLHITEIFPLYTILDEFGPLLSVAILSSYIVSITAYSSALLRGAQHRMSGNVIYDFFMGAELNPRIGNLDFKMLLMVRLPWFILFALSCATAARQYDEHGFISAEVVFIVFAHFLYANACAKGEECIVTTWYQTPTLHNFALIYVCRTPIVR